MHSYGRTAKLPSSENDVKKLVKEWYTLHGGWSFAAPTSRGMGVHGIHDRIGVIPVRITPEMVGKTVGVFVSVEAKKPGRRDEKNAGATQGQIDFGKDVLRHFGFAALADCQLDLERLHRHLGHLRAVPDDGAAGSAAVDFCDRFQGRR